ncbi:MAG: DUF86 domain-containing protein [Armatimonadetes bacterium]|nr:DUF86 domain-containing protein [Armatimonadota bacterium]
MDTLDRTALEDFCRSNDLEFLVLFGSRARKTEQPGSDFDLAAMASTDENRSWETFRNLIHTLKRSDLDFAWLPTASWLLSWEVARDGKVLYERRAGAFEKFRRAALLRRMDSQIWRKRNRDYVEAFLNGGRNLNTELVEQKLVLLANYLQELEQVLPAELAVFTSDFRVHRVVERQVELLVECATAINVEVAHTVGKTPPADYYSSFFSLSQAGWLSNDTAQALAPLATLRNRIVHQYEEVELDKLHSDVTASLPHWRAYLRSVKEKLASQS